VNNFADQIPALEAKDHRTVNNPTEARIISWVCTYMCQYGPYSIPLFISLLTCCLPYVLVLLRMHILQLKTTLCACTSELTSRLFPSQVLCGAKLTTCESRVV
jgi:hypothetical protein